MNRAVLLALLAGCGGAAASGDRTTVASQRHGLSEFARDYDHDRDRDLDCFTASTDAQFDHVLRDAGHHGWDLIMIGPSRYCIQRPHGEASPAEAAAESARRR